MMRIQQLRYYLVCVLLVALVLVPGARGFHTASTWQERPAPLVAVTAAASSSPSTAAEFPTSSGGGATTTLEETRKAAETQTLTEASSVAIATNKPHSVLSLVRQYRVTLISWSLLALGAGLTHNLALSAHALRMRRNILAGSIIFTVGDIGAQLLTFWSMQKQRRRQPSPADSTTTGVLSSSASSSFTLDQQRLTISTILGVGWAGVVVPFIYALVEGLLPGHQGVGRILLKMALSCSFLSTAGNWITMFFRRFVSQVCNLVMEQWRDRKATHVSSASSSASFAKWWWPNLRARWTQCVQSCNADFYEVLLDDLKIWPLYDILCYACIPPFIRPITTAIMSSLWSMYMSIASAAVHVHQGGDGKEDQQEQPLTQHESAKAMQESPFEATSDDPVGAGVNTTAALVDG